MGITTVSSDSSSQINILSNDHTVLIKSGVYLVTNGITAIKSTSAFSRATLLIDGNVLSYDAANVVELGYDDINGGNNNVVIGHNALVESDADGIISRGGSLSLSNNGSLFAAAVTLSMSGSNNAVSNAGLIQSANDRAIVSTGGQARISNQGTISGYTMAIEISSGSAEIRNTGLVTVTSPYGAAIQFGATGSLINSGEIHGNYTAIFSNTGSLDIRNTGYIRGYIDTGINADKVANFGGIIDGTIFMGDDADRVTNLGGTINGDVNLGNGGDTFVGKGGIVNGRIFGGDGDDYYRIDSAVYQIGEASGEGNDTVITPVSYGLEDNVENLTLEGKAALTGTGNKLANTIIGNIGSNKLYGQAGNDDLAGGAGSDYLNGGSGVDTALYSFDAKGVTVNLSTGKGSGGQAEGDRLVSIENLTGTTGNDVFTGNAAANKFAGILGNDKLTGGSGNDTFVFYATSDKDTITDFGKGNDTVELAGFAGITNYTQLKTHMTNVGADVVIDFGSGDAITFKNFHKADFNAADFVFIA